MAIATPQKEVFEAAPPPFIPPAAALRKVPWRQPTHLDPRHPAPPLMSKYAMPSTAGPVPARALPPRGASSFTPQAPVVPFPHPEHHSTPLNKHLPRPFGHGRSASSASMAPLVVVAPDPKTAAKIALLDQGLPTLPSPGGLGLFSQSYEEPASAIPIGFPRRPTGTRRATISEVRLTAPSPSPEEEQLIAKEHQRQDAMWEQEQAVRKRELEEERLKYEEEMARSFTQQPLKSRKRSPSIRPPAKSDSPLLNEFGLPSPPATSSTPPSNAIKPPISTKEERLKWRNEIRNVIGRQQEEERVAYEQAAHAEQQRLWRDNARRDRARKEAEATRAAEQVQSFVPREMPYSDYSRTQVKVMASKRDVDAKRQIRSRRKATRESGYMSSERRSSDGFGRSSANSHYRFSRAKRYYGEGTTDLREEGQDEPILNHSDGWEDIDTGKLKEEQEARLAVVAFNLYESRWAQLVNTPPEENSLRFVDIPWPSLESLPSTESPRSPNAKKRNLIPSALQISSVLNPKAVGDFLLSPHHSKDKTRRLRLRAAFLRFHPDKVSRWLNLIQESERGAVIMGVEIVVRCLNELMDKSSS